MKIVLNADLPVVEVNEWTAKTRAERRAGGHKEFADKFVYKTRDIAESDTNARWHGTPNAQVVRGVGDHELTQSGFANVVAEAYSNHLGLVLHPHDIWYVALSNIAAIVGERPANYKGLYAVGEDKQMLLVDQDHATDINVEALTAKLAAAMPTDIKMFLPELSTATPEAKIAMASAVLDAAKNFYDYGMFCCGIPFIDLRGTVDDWNSLIACINSINTEIAKLEKPQLAQKLSKYLRDVNSVIVQIAEAYTSDQSVFFRDIFTKENVGSGGDLKITGWITELYHNVKNGDLIRSFHDTVSSFTYENVSTKEHFIQFHGAFGSNVVDGAIEIAYDHVTVKYKPKA